MVYIRHENLSINYFGSLHHHSNTSAYSSNPIFPCSLSYQSPAAIMHFNLALVAAVAAFVPSTMACVGKSNMPKATDTKSSSAYIEVKAGQTYDGKFVRFDRGSGACTGGEGGKLLGSVGVEED